MNAFKEEFRGFMEELGLELGWQDEQIMNLSQFFSSYIHRATLATLCTLKVRQICDLIKHILKALEWRR